VSCSIKPPGCILCSCTIRKSNEYEY
jgi:hypothetical protein